MKIKESALKKWTGSYRGVSFEINNWQNEYDGRENWTYYLILWIDKIPEENKPKSFWLRGKKWRDHVIYDYCKHPIISGIDFHCGCTFYDKISGFDGERKLIKIGCDYSHYWDEGQYYNLDIIKNDVRHTIDRFLEHIPGYKYNCRGNGKLYDLKDGRVNEHGNFYSNEYKLTKTKT
jgi:hypothetical protein